MRKAVLIGAMLGLAGCGQGNTLERISGPTMGSSYTVQYVRTPQGPAPELVKREVERILEGVDRRFSTYRSDSLTEAFNRLPANSCQSMPADVLQLVRVGEQLAQQSDGAFDLTVEPLLDLWGFGPQSRMEKVPDAQALAATRQRVGHGHLRIVGEQLCKDAPVEVDFNSIAAGHAVDLLVERLKALGVANLLVEATGELKAIGRKADGSPWKVALELPRADRQIAQQVLDVDGFGVSTSGDYRNYFEENGQRYSHTFDARQGKPVKHELASVTVFDRSTLMADGYSTLLLILGPERGWEFALRHGIGAVFVTRVADGFVSRSTPAFAQVLVN
ncbi:FAD:protein FMN transferase [Pseudomonas sp. NPDC087612]|uniref:FAD:protein FMN transferase n=1 Tax=unclassified Pseudomonas TaxID=196821 RepID=UPI0005EADA3F|nr:MULTISPECIES: FAD:protein FMN transferase [unclassified Pseudomonas]KJK19290.1 thiamine biosynthesis protein ApbE [Pseudomonas sp. 2(2015)]QVM98348.1 FAD:protein FMN transferase [Pseudomonas sp. SORT22]UVM54326.1 FAD:protein FMN transferase [Pseudomonas sp. B21-012]SDQ54272.1 thiamine biosynthesis lipoprotein [Pseudomonas sp. UC 17F4]